MMIKNISWKTFSRRHFPADVVKGEGFCSKTTWQNGQTNKFPSNINTQLRLDVGRFVVKKRNAPKCQKEKFHLINYFFPLSTGKYVFLPPFIFCSLSRCSIFACLIRVRSSRLRRKTPFIASGREKFFFAGLENQIISKAPPTLEEWSGKRKVNHN